MNERKWLSHVYVLDFSRGIAALSVVLWHWQHFACKRVEETFKFQKESKPKDFIISVILSLLAVVFYLDMVSFCLLPYGRIGLVCSISLLIVFIGLVEFNEIIFCRHFT